jgi:hypothetical protein
MVQQLNGLQEIQAATGRAQATMLSNQLIADMAARVEVNSRLSDEPAPPPAGTIELKTLDGRPIPR